MEITVSPFIEHLYQVLDLVGVVLNGIIGGSIARQRNFDIVGFIFLALFSALAGGMIRDMLIGHGTAAAIADPAYISLACLGALIAYLLAPTGRLWELLKVHGDAVILGVWATTGCVKALAYGMPLIACVFMGVLTAVGGGMIRDIASGMTPSIFGGSPLYAVPAVITGVTMVLFSEAGYFAAGMLVSPVLGTGLAVLAYWRKWVLPTDFSARPQIRRTRLLPRGGKSTAGGKLTVQDSGIKAKRIARQRRSRSDN